MVTLLVSTDLSTLPFLSKALRTDCSVKGNSVGDELVESIKVEHNYCQLG